MNVAQAVERALLGEAIGSLSAAYREGLLVADGIDPKEASKTTFAEETRLFVNRVCRELGDRHPADHRALVALRDWVRRADDYEGYDALLTHFDFEGKDVIIRRGRVLFPGPMTSHWAS